MSSFYFGSGDEAILVTHPDGLTQEQIEGFPAFQNWIKTFKKSLTMQKYQNHPYHEDLYTLRSINILSFFLVGLKENRSVLFLYLETIVANKNEKKLPGVVFLRGGSVAILIILRPSDSYDERYVVMIEQPRVAAGSLRFMEIPAGILDPTVGFKNPATQKLWDVVGLVLKEEDLTNMTDLALKDQSTDELLPAAMYPSVGGCDEYVKIYLWEREMDRMEIDALRTQFSGSRSDDNVAVRLLSYENLLQVGARDGKTLAAWALYEYLKSTRQIDSNGKPVAGGRRQSSS
jgi:ADP-sugar diphosphatase